MPLLRRASNQPRGAARRRLKELTEQREQGLRDLGRLTVAMHQQGAIESGRLFARAADVAAIDDEIRRLQQGDESGGEASGPAAPGTAKEGADSTPESAGAARRSGAARSRA